MRTLLLTTVLWLSSSGALGQDILAPANDACSTPFIGGDGTYTFDTTLATESGIEPSGLPPWVDDLTPDTACEDFNGSPDEMNKDVWMEWAAAGDGSYRIVTCNQASYDTKLALYSGSGASCGSLVPLACNDDDSICAGFTSTLLTASITSGDTYMIQVGGFGPSSTGSGSLTIENLIPCAQQSDDGFEPNDACNAPTPGLLPGSYTNLRLFLGNDDYYEIVVAPGDVLEVDASGNLADGNLDIEIYDSTCTVPVASSTADNTSNESASISNTMGSPQSYRVRIFMPTSFPGCMSYDMDVTVIPDLCLSASDDALEDNDSCGTALPRGAGTDTGLFVSRTDRDFYTVSLNPGSTLSVEVTFAHILGDIDAYLYDPTACGNTLVFLDRGFSSSDNELISWMNTTGIPQTYILEIQIYSESTLSDCNSYDLSIAGAATAPIGVNFCPSAPNSQTPPGGTTGAIITAQGSASVAANDLTLLAGPMDANQPGIFFYGPFQLRMGMGFPFGEGQRCAGGRTVRLLPPNFSDGSGVLTGVVDNTDPFVAGSSMPIVPMASYNFQAWYRDPACTGAITGIPGDCNNDGIGDGFNLSNALRIVFTP